MSHYEAFQSEHEEITANVYSTYLEFYKVKQEFVKKRQAFLHALTQTEKGSSLQPLLAAESEVQGNKEQMISEESETTTQQQTKSSPLFHKLALATHPDKHPDCNPVFFQQAQKANEQGKFAKLLFLCRYLRIDTPTSLTPEELAELQAAIEKKKKKIEHYKKTYPWLYGNADTEELRKKIMEAFCKVNAS